MNNELCFGPGYITLDQIYLAELRQVSPASFQPILAVLRPQASQVPQVYAQAGATSGEFPSVFPDSVSEWQGFPGSFLPDMSTYGF